MPDEQELRGDEGVSAQHLDWRTVEALGHAYFIQRGWRVLISPYDTATYDFVAERDSVFVRVNVKSAKRSSGSYRISKPGGQRNRGDLRPRPDPDHYLVWLVDHRRFVELPGDFLAEVSCKAVPSSLYKEHS